MSGRIVVGQSNDRAFVYDLNDSTGMKDIAPAGQNYSKATAIMDRWVVGVTGGDLYAGTSRSQAFVYDRTKSTDGFEYLEVPVGFVGSEATGVAATRTAVHVVGTSTKADGTLQATVWTKRLAPAPAPTITGIDPASGPAAGGTQATIAGTGFRQGAKVTIGGADATVSSVTDTSITVTVPAGTAGARDVVVTNPDGQGVTRTGGFTYEQAQAPAPTVTGIGPASGSVAGGTLATIDGTGFQQGAKVTIGGAEATHSSMGDTWIQVRIPAGTAGARDVVVTNPDGQKATLAGGFTYQPMAPAPTITRISPDNGPIGGMSATITGTGFDQYASVTIGGITANRLGTPTSTEIRIAVPPGMGGPQDVVVTNSDGQSATLKQGFTYWVTPPPQPPGPNFAVTGAIGEKWRATGGLDGPLGQPLDREHDGLVRGGWYQMFTGGTITWAPGVPASITKNAIRGKWMSLGAENGRLGYPVTDEICGIKDGGCYQGFQGGYLVWSPQTGTHVSWGGIRSVWMANRAENGRLGYATSDEIALTNGGFRQDFQGGSVYWSPAGGGHPVWGGIGSFWKARGAETSSYGYPTSGEQCGQVNGVEQCVQYFQRGSISWNARVGIF